MIKLKNTYRRDVVGILLLLLLYGLPSIQGQDVEELLVNVGDSTYFVEKLIDEAPFSISGDYGLLMRSYSTDADIDRQTPLNSMAYANITAEVEEITIPINLILNNLDDFSHPFHRGYAKGIFTNVKDRLTRVGLSPYYKWIKVHAGHRYMTMSNFTLADHSFLGGGVELTPGNWRIAAMAGRLAKAEPVDLAIDEFAFPVYRRTGWALKVGYGNERDFIDLIMFQAKDDPESLTENNIADFSMQPAENVVLGIKGQKTIIENLDLDFEIARSGFTRNLEDEYVRESRFFADYNRFLFRRKISTYYGNAIAANLNYDLEKTQIGMSYQRIDPRFQTFGAYFFDVDLENYTFNLTGYGWGNFSFMGTAGLQRNNLDKSSLTTHKRLIGSANLSYQLETWSFGVDYSNYKSDIRYLMSSGFDSLKVVIVTSDASLNISKNIVGDGGWGQNINFLGGMQTVNQNIETPTGDPDTKMYYANLGYNIRTPRKWNLRVSLDYNQNSINEFEQKRYGCGGQLSKAWFDDKLAISIGAQVYVSNSSGGELRSRQSNQNLRAFWEINELHNLELKFSTIQNETINAGVKDKFSEMVISLGFSGQFGYTPNLLNSRRRHDN